VSFRAQDNGRRDGEFFIIIHDHHVGHRSILLFATPGKNLGARSLHLCHVVVY
jgi:hypothetical protein